MIDIQDSIERVQEPIKSLILHSFQASLVKPILQQNISDVKEQMTNLSVTDIDQFTRSYLQCKWQIDFLTSFIRLCDKITDVQQQNGERQ